MTVGTDEALEDLLLDHEEERLSTQEEIATTAQARFRAVAKAVIALLRGSSPSDGALRKARAMIKRALVLELAGAGNGLKRGVIRREVKKHVAFSRRSGKRIRLAPITKKRLEERRARLEKAAGGEQT